MTTSNPLNAFQEFRKNGYTDFVSKNGNAYSIGTVLEHMVKIEIKEPEEEWRHLFAFKSSMDITLDYIGFELKFN